MKSYSAKIANSVSAAALTLLTTHSALAQTAAAPTAAATSETKVEQKSRYQKARDLFNLSYTLVYNGPSIAAPISHMQPNEGVDFKGTGGDPIELQNQFSFAGVFKNGMNLGPTLDLRFLPIGNDKDLIMKKLDVRFRMPNVLKAETKVGEITFSPDIRLTPGAGRTQRKRGMSVGLGVGNNINWTIGKSIVSASLFTLIDYTAYYKSGSGDGNYLTLVAEPGINVQVHKKVGLYTNIEFDGGLARASGVFENQGIYWGLGASINPIPELTISPFLNFKPNEKDFGRMTSMHLSISASIL